MNYSINSAEQTVVITVPGDIVSTNADQVRKEIMEVLDGASVKAAKAATIRLDLSAAKMIDSVGLNLIVGVYKEAKKRGAATSALLSSPNIQRTFYFTRLDTHIQVVMAK